MKKTILLIIVCSILGGCASLVLKEKERSLLSSYEKGKIDKIQYLSGKAELEKERAMLEAK